MRTAIRSSARYKSPVLLVILLLSALAIPSGNRIPIQKPNIFGIWMGGGDNSTVYLLKKTGATWTRVYLQWNTVEPAYTSPPTYEFRYYDSLLASLGAAGITTIAEVRANPTWAASTVCGPIDKPGGQDSFARFLRAVVGRYSQPPYNVKHWELYNEADNADMGTLGAFLGGCWGNYPGEYAAMLRLAYNTIKGADPASQVLIGGLAHESAAAFNADFLDRVLTAGAGNYFDVMNIHYYSSFAANWATYGADIAGKIRAVRQTMANYGVDKPVAVTEAGWTSSPSDSVDFVEDQARYVPKLLARSMAAGLYNVLWFSLMDWSGADYPYGLADVDMRTRPSYKAYAVAVSEIGQADAVRELSPTEVGADNQEIKGYAFKVGKSERWLLWSESGGAVQIALPARAFEAMDKMGSPIWLSRSGAPRAVGLDSSPIYVRVTPLDPRAAPGYAVTLRGQK